MSQHNDISTNLGIGYYQFLFISKIKYVQYVLFFYCFVVIQVSCCCFSSFFVSLLSSNFLWLLRTRSQNLTHVMLGGGYDLRKEEEVVHTHTVVVFSQFTIIINM